MSLVLRQIAAVIRLEWKKTFLSRRGFWVYLLALAPAGLTLLHAAFSSRSHAMGRRGHTLFQDTEVFAVMFQTYFLRLGIFFGSVGIFSNLFRGEMLEKTLHYYLLVPIRREWLVLGKYVSGLLVAVVLFTLSVAASMYLIGRHQGAAWEEFVLHGAGRAQLAQYLLITILACLGYGAVFLLSGLVVRNPMIPAAVVMVWENLNPFLPRFLKEISIIFYLQGLSPVNVPGIPPPLSVLVVDSDPIPGSIAVPGLLVVACALLAYAATRARTLEISYGE
ncbi:MAG: ABC transporter permease [Acidobacteriia bacterium]|nr:ABC transporter permease [Terriglobia bacterium]